MPDGLTWEAFTARTTGPPPKSARKIEPSLRSAGTAMRPLQVTCMRRPSARLGAEGTPRVEPGETTGPHPHTVDQPAAARPAVKPGDPFSWKLDGLNPYSPDAAVCG